MRIRFAEKFRLPGGFTMPDRRKRRLLAAALALVLAVVAAAGGAYFYVEKKKHSLSYAVERLNEALATADLAALSMRVDFRTLSSGLVDAWSKVVPGKAPQTDIARRALEDAVQASLYKAFTAPRSGGEAQEQEGKAEAKTAEQVPEKSSEKSPEKAPEKSEDKKDAGDKPATVATDRFSVPLPTVPLMLPQDFAAQLSATPFRVLGEDGDQALVASRLRHADLSLDLPLQLLAVKKNGDWLFERLVNADQLAADYDKAQQMFKMRREAMFFARNAEIREVMSRHCYVTTCNVGVAKVGKDGSVLISLSLEGSNTGDETLRSAGLRCAIRDQRGNVVKDMPLNFSRQVKPGSMFRQYWNFEFDSGTPEAAALIHGGPLTCTTEVQAVSLANGRLIYPRSYSEIADKPATGHTEKPK